MRVRFLVDGFNLYHSVKSAERTLSSGPLRWLDIRRLCQTLVQSSFGPGHTLEGVHYFSALATHLESAKPDVVRRHRTYLAALRSTGVAIEMAKFKKKTRQKTLKEMKIQVQPFRRWFQIPLSFVRLSFTTHEEKETDVAIACRLLELLARGACDAAVVMSGDTDVAPAIRTATSLYPAADIGVAFPFDRHNRDLEKLGHRHVKLGAQLYQSHQFPPAIVTANGRVITKPTAW